MLRASHSKESDAAAASSHDGMMSPAHAAPLHHHGGHPLPLEESDDCHDEDDNDTDEKKLHHPLLPPPGQPMEKVVSDLWRKLPSNTDEVMSALRRLVTWLRNLSGKTIVSLFMITCLALVIYDTVLTPPEHRRIFKPGFSQSFLLWVEYHPVRGVVALLVVIALAVVLMIPIGTPLTLGCGYIYKTTYGWKLGMTIATTVSMVGSALGAVICFLLGRYLLRDYVRQNMMKKYPIFDAIDLAAAEHGLKIMAMLYLTPILPLGPVSYMCGATSMALSSFVLAKFASLPLMLLYCFIGASTGALIGKKEAVVKPAEAAAVAFSAMDAQEDHMSEIENNHTLILSGIGLSFVMIAMITTYIRKELNKVGDQ
jgi:uncharacterized membrane protein YdjX (TVP38/TMEM64 family)